MGEGSVDGEGTLSGERVFHMHQGTNKYALRLFVYCSSGLLIKFFPFNKALPFILHFGYITSWGCSVINRLLAPVCPNHRISTQEQFWSLGIAPFERPPIAGTTTSSLQKFAQFTVADVAWSLLYKLSSSHTD